MKKTYEKATVKITLFDNSDVVTTSSLEINGEDECPYGSHKNDKHQEDECVNNPGFKHKNDNG